MLNGHKVFCPRCNTELSELRIPYMDYVNLDKPARQALVNRCADPHQLQHLRTTYRMFKYSKWYHEKQLHIKNDHACQN